MKANFQKWTDVYFMNVNPKSLLKYKASKEGYVTLVIRKNPKPTCKIDKYLIEMHRKNIKFKKRNRFWQFIINLFKRWNKTSI